MPGDNELEGALAFRLHGNRGGNAGFAAECAGVQELAAGNRFDGKMGEPVVHTLGGAIAYLPFDKATIATATSWIVAFSSFGSCPMARNNHPQSVIQTLAQADRRFFGNF